MSTAKPNYDYQQYYLNTNNINNNNNNSNHTNHPQHLPNGSLSYHQLLHNNNSNNHIEPSVSPPEREADTESIISNVSEISTGALHNIREQMAMSLKRMRDLEEQVKQMPVLQVNKHTIFECFSS